jgi:hypothetical protein
MATMRPTPRNELLGLLSDYMTGGLAYMRDPQRTQQMQGLAGLLESTGIPKTTERMAYGEPLTNIGRANVPLLKPETADALMTVAPFAPKGMKMIRATEGMPVGMSIDLGPNFLGKRPPKIENLARTSDKFLFHSSTADKAKDLRYGIEPQAGGNWVREVASGATDQNLDDFFKNVTPLAWFSDKPEWIKAMVGRKLNKPFDKVTAKDIEKHGHLAFINKKSSDAENITYIPNEGLMEGGQSKVFDIQGNPKKAWETGLYQEGRYGTQMEPFGVERNEYVSPESIEPLLQLTGPELVEFMKLKGFLDKTTEGIPVGKGMVKEIPKKSSLLDMTRTPSEAEIKKMSREDLIQWLQNNDPDGQYMDPTPNPSVSMYRTGKGYAVENADSGDVFEFKDFNEAQDEFNSMRFSNAEFPPMTLQEAQESAINYLREFAQPEEGAKVIPFQSKGLLSP